MKNRTGIFVVIPCFRVRSHILGVLSRIPREVERVLVIDDHCPEGTGDWVQSRCKDRRVRVIRHEANQGVGGAMVTGYREALAQGARVVVKLDGDGQMDPALIHHLVHPVLAGKCDFAKGNRFHHPRALKGMPGARVIGNVFLSFIAKAASGYWNIMDPTNGYTAIHAKVLALMPLDRIAKGFFFESDLLCRLGLARAKVMDVPMASVYGDEKSNLRIGRVLLTFPGLFGLAMARRLATQYYLRDINPASLGLAVGLMLVGFGGAYGLKNWLGNLGTGNTTPAGTVMLAGLPTILGFQLILTAFQYDIAAVPQAVLHPELPDVPRTSKKGGSAVGR